MRNHTFHLRHGSTGVAFFSEKGRSFAEQKATLRQRRGGAVIIVVLALLSLMIFLGVFFFEFVQEEQLASQNYANNLFDPLNPDRYMDEADKQLIVGPDWTRTMSVLYSNPTVGEDANGNGSLDPGEDINGNGVLDYTTGEDVNWNNILDPGEDTNGNGILDYFSTTPPNGLNYGQPGTPHSLLAHIIGRIRANTNGLNPTDVLPHNGHGITTMFRAGIEDINNDGIFTPGTDYVSFDFDGDGNADSVLDPSGVSGSTLPAFGINFSRPAQVNPAADAFSQAAGVALRPFQPDVEYTYPDINNLFLAYDIRNRTTGQRILVPSFHRPDLFPNMRTDATLNAAAGGFQNLYTNAATKQLVMRPHKRHQYPDGTYRFLSDLSRLASGITDSSTPAQSGDRARRLPDFPYEIDSNNDFDVNDMGVYSYDSTNAVLKTNYDLDVDLNGDGEPDGIWMDLGLDIVDMADGRQFVPLFSYLVLDADSLINLNAHGNLQGLFENAAAYNSYGTTPITPFSASNTGASPSEVNVMRALTGNPGALPSSQVALAQAEHAFNYSYAFAAATAQDIPTMANMELAFLLAGRATLRSSARLSGRYGEEYLIGSGTYPRPGITGTDDDLDNFPDGTPYGSRYSGGAQRYLTNTTGYPDQRLYDPRSGSIQVLTPQSSHPLDPKGTGSGTYTNTPTVLQLVQGVTGGNPSPVIWPQYLAVQPTVASSWEAPRTTSLTVPTNAVTPVQSPYPYGPAASPLTADLFQGPATITNMVDEDDEMRIANPDRINDDIFLAEENLKLQLSSADYQRIGASSRLAALAPFNFVYSPTAPQTLKRFTTDSWDFSELAYVPSRYVGGVNTETSVWTGARRFFPPAFGGTLFTGTDPIRPEVRALMACEDSNDVNNTNNPRRELNTTLFTYINGNAAASPVSLWRQPLNLNKLLVGFDADGYPVFRDLMPHPDMVALEYQDTNTNMPAITIPAMIHSNDQSMTGQPIPGTAAFSNMTTPTPPSSDSDTLWAQRATAQEWWARYDRQRMARDIYTLLYLVGAPNGTNPATTPYPNPEKVREMAQFAVNYVDALDRDDVITRFEYDDNLSDGWNTSPSKVVYGIERASLSFSEVQFLQTNPQMSDYTTTLHKDSDYNVHQYLHMELRNSSPFTVNLAEGWRISRVTKGTGTRDKSVEFKTNGFGTAGWDTKKVQPGGNFLIGTHDGNVVNTAGTAIVSDFYADAVPGGGLESILPTSANTVPNASANPEPQTDLDLAVPATHSHYQYYTHVAGVGMPSSTYENPPAPALPPSKLVRQIVNSAAMTNAIPEPNVDYPNSDFDLVLERRQNLSGVETAPAGTLITSSTMGDWIEVDRFQVRTNDMGGVDPGTSKNAIFNPVTPGGQTDVTTTVDTLNSVERRQPFDPVQIPHARGAPSPALYTPGNTMNVVGSPPTPSAITQSGPNSAFAGPYTLWQPHFDRDFTSAYELLSVPLYGNWPLTELVNGLNTETTASTPAGTRPPNTYYKELHGGTQFNLAPGATNAASGKMTGDFTAGIRFNFPNGVPGKPYQGWNPYAYQNCWYRLFDFVTVPRRADQQSEAILTGSNNVAGSTKPVFRVPGKINLNTMRDETILAALLDDAVHLTYGNGTNDNITAGRNWFLELLQSRDGTDYFASAAGQPGVPIPNSLVSRPFRGTSHVDPSQTTTVDDAVENGLLRSSVPVTRGAVPDPRIRPAGTTPYVAPTLTTPVDYSSPWSTNPHNTLAVNWQGLFDSGDLSNTGIDHHTRNRILAKIANNSTNKSHVYFVWTAVGYFEAHRESTNNRVQIGARLTDIPIHRRFSVVDMSKLDDAYDTQSNTFDEKKFLIFQKRLR